MICVPRVLLSKHMIGHWLLPHFSKRKVLPLLVMPPMGNHCMKPPTPVIAVTATWPRKGQTALGRGWVIWRSVVTALLKGTRPQTTPTSLFSTPMPILPRTAPLGHVHLPARCPVTSRPAFVIHKVWLIC